jgi:hypothetical protein
MPEYTLSTEMELTHSVIIIKTPCYFRAQLVFDEISEIQTSYIECNFL